MAVSSISSYNTTRFTGMASGMDTDTLVQRMMNLEQMKVDRLYQKNTKLEWKRDSYTEFNTGVKDIRNKFMSTLSKDNVMSPNVYRAFKVNMDESKYISIKANSGAEIGNHKITSVQMAEAATLEGVKKRNQVGLTSSITGYNSVHNISGDVKMVDAQGSATYDNNTKLLDLKDDAGNAVFAFATPTSKLEFSINGEKFSFGQNEKLRDVLQAVNNSKAGALVSLDPTAGKFKIEDVREGVKKEMVLTNTAGPEVFGTGKLFSAKSGELKPKNVISDTNITLGDLSKSISKYSAFSSDDRMKFSINGEEFTFRKTDKLSDVLNAINSNEKANATATYDVASDTFSIKSNTFGNEAKLELKNIEGKAFGLDGLFGIEGNTKTSNKPIDRATDTIQSAATKMGVILAKDDDGKFAFKINGKEFAFDTDTKLQDMIDKVNASDARAIMSYSQITDSFVIKSKDTGLSSSVSTVNNSRSNAFGGVDSFFGIEQKYVSGKNAKLVMDGEEISKTSNTFVVDGLEINLKSNFNVENKVLKEEEKIGFSLSQDVDGVVEKVKAFVEEYNKFIKKYSSAMVEQIDYDAGYEPLTEAQREDMSEKEIELWETEAKKGLIRNDPTISKMLSDLRKAMFDKVGDSGISPHEIGITTGYLAMDGQIVFNEETFKAALTKDPSSVGKIMGNMVENKEGVDQYKESGFITRAFDLMTTAETTISKRNLVDTKKQITENDKSMKDLLTKMHQKEERYYLQYAQMEKMMAQYQQQSAWLTQQLAAMTKK